MKTIAGDCLIDFDVISHFFGKQRMPSLLGAQAPFARRYRRLTGTAIRPTMKHSDYAVHLPGAQRMDSGEMNLSAMPCPCGFLSGFDMVRMSLADRPQIGFPTGSIAIQQPPDYVLAKVLDEVRGDPAF